MSAQTAATLPTVVRRCVAKIIHPGDEVVIQIRNEPTSDIMVSNYVGRVELVLWEGEKVERLMVRVPRERTPSIYENVLTFMVVDEWPDEWKQRLLRRRG